MSGHSLATQSHVIRIGSYVLRSAGGVLYGEIANPRGCATEAQRFIPSIVQRFFGFVCRESRNEMLEDKRPDGFQPQRVVRLVPTESPCDRQRREQSRIQLARPHPTWPVDRLCSVLLRAIRSRLRIIVKVPGRRLRDLAPLW